MHAPRPLPLFLELVRMVSEHDRELAAAALRGLARYQQAPRRKRHPERPAAFKMGPASLRDVGGNGPPAVLVPSLINPPDVLDLDETVSLAKALAGGGRRIYLLDWGAAGERDLDLGGHIAELAMPLLRELDRPPALVGYCLGGTMAIAIANLVDVERVATIAAPWHFSAYPKASRDSLTSLWKSASATARQLNALPMEVLQGAFWSLDPERTVAKFASFAALPPDSAAAQRFVILEDWANEGEPLPFPAARELLEDLFASDLPGSGRWMVDGRPVTDSIACPLLNVTASGDRIAPSATAPSGSSAQVESGHVGMIVGSARTKLHEQLRGFLAE